MTLVNPPSCEKEQAVAEALRLHRWDEDLRAHALGCAICADVVMVASFLESQAAAADPSSEPLPDPGLIYWKAQIQARRDAAARATRPIAIAEKLSWGGGIVAAAAILAWVQPDFLGWLSRVPSLWHAALTAAPAALTSTNLFYLAMLGLLPVYLTFSVIHAIRSTD